MGNKRHELHEVTRKMEQYVGKNLLEAAKKQLAISADELVAEAKARCPESVQLRKGRQKHLKESIHKVEKDNGEYFEIVADAEDEYGVAYGRFVEFSPKIDKPFLYPAMDKLRSKIKQDIVRAVQGAIHGKRG